jgi:DNA-binding NarL/FixJ family response regulator
MLRLVLIAFEPVLHELLSRRLGNAFQIVGAARTPIEALAVARATSADAILVDADLTEGEPTDLVAKLVLVGAAPIVALSARAAPGRWEAAELLAAGARAVLHKTAGPLPLDLATELGDRLTATLRQVGSP